MNSTRKCKECETEKNLADFYLDKRTSDSLSKICISCKNNKEKESNLKRQRLYRKGKGKDRRKEWLKYFYDLTSEQYFELLKNQNHCCKICGTHEKDAYKQTLFVDHDHDTGKVRGLLCNSCNTALGHFKDSQEILKNAMDYLNESRC